MDDRLIQLKRLKKAYKKERRRALWGFDVAWYLMLALLAAAVCCLAYVWFYYHPVMRWFDSNIWTPFKNLVGIKVSLMWLGMIVRYYGFYLAGGFLTVFVLVWILRSAALSKIRCRDSYLDYKTVKNTLKTEKQEARR